MSTTSLPNLSFELNAEQKNEFERDGFLAMRGVFSRAEVDGLRERFMQMQRDALDPAAPLREHYKPLSMAQANGDILKHFPRIMHPARFDDTAKAWMLDGRIGAILEQLIEETPLAAQSMFYFKPPGAKGQALHQDNFYLNVSPRTCIAAWLSLDDADEENGGMFLVPGSHRLPVLCPHLADMDKSFTTEEVEIPAGLKAIPAPLKAGDMLFFTGSVIHGSYPNTSQNRFRRAFICHYVGDSTRSMDGGYYPLWRFSGEKLEREVNQSGSHSCGNEEWSDFQAAIAQFRAEHAAQSGAGVG